MTLHKRTRRIFAIQYIRQTIEREYNSLDSLKSLCEGNHATELAEGISQGIKRLEGALQAITDNLELWEV